MAGELDGTETPMSNPLVLHCSVSQLCSGSTVFPNLFHTLVFLRAVILRSVWQILAVDSLFLVVPEPENLSGYLLAIGVCSFEKCLFQSLTYFLMGCFTSGV